MTTLNDASQIKISLVDDGQQSVALAVVVPGIQGPSGTTLENIPLSKLAPGALPAGVTVASANIVDGTIVNADISSSAAIGLSKLAAGALPSGVTVASANIVDGTIVNADISSSAAIGLSKLATGALPSGVTVASANIVDGTIVNADISSSAAIDSSKLGFSQAGGSAVAQTVQAKLRDLVSVKDFGAGTTANDAPAFAAASNVSGNPAVFVPAGTYQFGSTPSLAQDSVFIFDNGASFTGTWPTSAKRIHLGDANSWVSTIAGGIYTYLDFNPVLNIRPSITSVGISCAQQTSEITYGFGTGSGALSFSSFIHNNNPTADTTAWPFYSTVLHDTPLGISHCMEVDIFNRSAVVEVTPHRIAKAGMTNGLWIGAGGEYTQQPTVQPEAGIASVAIAIVRNDSRPVKAACWDKGILFHSTAIRGVDGFEGTGGNGCAIGFANRHFMKWFRNTDDAVIGEIGSTSNGVQPTRVTFTDIGFLISSITNNNIALQVENPATATTGIQIAPNANAGSAPLILARGNAANIDLMLSGKGTGGLGFNGGTRLKWINPGDGQLLADIIHSGVGSMRPQLNLSNGFGFLASSAVNGNVCLQVEIPSDATTGVQIVPNANDGPSPLIQARGNAANIDLFLAAKGTGVIGFGDGAYMRWHKASDNSALAEIGQTSTGAMRARLSFTDSGLLVSSLVNNNTAFQIESPSTATTGVQIAPNANGGVTPLILARGTSANIDLWLAPKGTGHLRFGIVTATPVTNNGYITIRDNAGNLVKLMTAA
jgi:hypothetical protein